MKIKFYNKTINKNRKGYLPSVQVLYKDLCRLGKVLEEQCKILRRKKTDRKIIKTIILSENLYFVFLFRNQVEHNQHFNITKIV